MVSIEEWQLLSFFNAVATPLDPDVPWPYNEFRFEVEREDMALSCCIAPAYKDIHLIVKQSSKTVFELNAVDVDDIRYHSDGGRETLEIILSDRVTTWLRLEPELQIKQVVSAKE